MSMAEEEEDFEVLDLSAARGANGYIQQILGDVSRQSVAKQVMIGGAAGCASGYLSVKVGKTAAISLGLTILLIRIAQHQGYIQINWSRVNREMERAKRRMAAEANRQYPNLIDNLRRFAQQNVFLAGSFAGGFFLGLAF